MNNLFDNLIIFEMANNHQGDVNHGLAIIEDLGKIARKFEINAAVKFQYRDLDTIIHPDFITRKDVKHIPRFLQTQLSSDQFYRLVVAVQETGMHTMCTPFDEKSVGLCMDHGIDIIKIASCSSMDWPLLSEAVKAKRPIIVSTGGKTYSDMDKIYNFFTHSNVEFAMLHCVGLYPVKDEEVQLDNIDRMRDRYPNITIGYSGHENPDDYTIAQMAIAKGAKILERHIGKATETISINSYSTDTKDVHKWIEAILKARNICGERTEKRISEMEINSMNELARGCYAANHINKGDIITRENVFFAMPCLNSQTTSGQYQNDMVASKDYQPKEPLFEKRRLSIISDTRSVIHDVKGMLYEGHIVVGDEFNLELSHHYGMEHFRRYGSTLISIVNREYCKKLLIMLPGQENPTHLHKVKEETFQVLYGKLQLVLDGKDLELNTGEILTVERGVPHSFYSINGCVFEEISTTHVRNDSFYEDTKISSLDPMERKTVLTEW